ncbi:type II toxin-antitoxin system RatA family toxin [Conservatibacter flavescens]|uniref:Ubiquinone-binding protein n=1 Tax=Conservatibacter flavescens TaxID=28161 RepID=A0A2M8S577_9PAST|nr:type II toxin-antitoxin system RatA family toxin [Conservatibacter flavescens]PJG86291.1 ubiquinone-binding protein [Conservatibacter flavescens]
MPQINQSALVPYSAKQMYQLVNDYERYPEFLPGCIASRTLQQNEYEMVGELTIRKAGIRQTFATQNTLSPAQSIEMKLVKGPFRFLQGRWDFEELDEKSCKISLQLEFEFTNPIIQFAFGKIFTELTAKMIEAFKKRAKEVYHGAN